MRFMPEKVLPDRLRLSIRKRTSSSPQDAGDERVPSMPPIFLDVLILGDYVLTIQTT